MKSQSLFSAGKRENINLSSETVLKVVKVTSVTSLHV